MHTRSSCIGRLLSALAIALLLTSISPPGFGQVNSRTVNITLVARLESLSVGATLPDDVGFPARGYDNSPQIPILLTTSWAVPSNRTTVRVVENGRTLFSQAAGDSDRPKTRIDQLNIVLRGDRSEVANPESQPCRVIIFVQAL